MSVKLLLDTDIGTDIDDAVCLAYLLANPSCDLMGITTVSGEPEQRARLASALCHVAGKSVPIYPGIAEPLLVAQRQPLAQQATVLERWPHQHDFAPGRALSFLRDTIRASPGEVTLLAIGPLTNIALLFSMDPELPALLKSLVMMCGVFTSRQSNTGPLEWNAMLDPHAAAMVYRQRTPVHRSIGIDVTVQVQLPADEVRMRFQTPLLQPVLEFAEVWFREQNQVTFHDPLAAATIFDPAICQFERGMVEVELVSPRLAGMTHWQPFASGQHEVALQVDRSRFFDHYFSFFA